MVAKLAQHRGQFGDIRAAAAKLGRHARFDQAGVLQGFVVLGNEAVVLVGVGGALGELHAEQARRCRNMPCLGVWQYSFSRDWTLRVSPSAVFAVWPRFG